MYIYRYININTYKYTLPATNMSPLKIIRKGVFHPTIDFSGTVNSPQVGNTPSTQRVLWEISLNFFPPNAPALICLHIQNRDKKCKAPSDWKPKNIRFPTLFCRRVRLHKIPFEQMVLQCHVDPFHTPSQAQFHFVRMIYPGILLRWSGFTDSVHGKADAELLVKAKWRQQGQNHHWNIHIDQSHAASMPTLLRRLLWKALRSGPLLMGVGKYGETHRLVGGVGKQSLIDLWTKNDYVPSGKLTQQWNEYIYIYVYLYTIPISNRKYIFNPGPFSSQLC